MPLTDPLTGHTLSYPTFEGGPSGKASDPSFESNSGGEPPRVLVVESIRSTRELLGMVLREHYDVESVATYEDALRRTQSVQFDAVLLSVSLSRFQSGVETLRKIRDQEGYADVPILAVTGPNLEKEQHRLREAGGDAFLEMPFVQADLLKLLERHLGL